MLREAYRRQARRSPCGQYVGVGDHTGRPVAFCWPVILEPVSLNYPFDSAGPVELQVCADKHEARVSNA